MPACGDVQVLLPSGVEANHVRGANGLEVIADRVANIATFRSQPGKLS